LPISSLPDACQAYLEFVVTSERDEWTITTKGRQLRTQATEADAIRSAIAAAHEAGLKGSRAEVFLREPGKCLRIVWIYGVDPFPPQNPQA
jgi:hypothetical protein